MPGRRGGRTWRRSREPARTRAGPAASHRSKKCSSVASAPCRAPRRVGERQRRRSAAAGRPGHRVEHAVDDHAPAPCREEVRVDVAEVRAVRHAVVGELLVADRLAQQVHVASDVRGRHVAQDRPAVTQAALAVAAERVDVRSELRVLVREERGAGQELVGGLVGREAAQRGRPGHATRVEPDDVEAGQDLRAPQELRGRDDRGAGAARTPRVHEHRPDAVGLVVGPTPGQGEVDRRPVRGVVVERHLRAGALQPVAAARPAQHRHPRRRRGIGAWPPAAAPRPAPPATRRPRPERSCCVPWSTSIPRRRDRSQHSAIVVPTATDNKHGTAPRRGAVTPTAVRRGGVAGTLPAWVGTYRWGASPASASA